jgi:hypothetical protein
MRRSLIAFLALVLAPVSGQAQVEDVVTAKLERYAIAALVDQDRDGGLRARSLT